MDSLKVALVGCGKVGRLHCLALKQCPDARLVALCDASETRAGQFASEFGGAAFTQLSQMLSLARPDVVLIATPHPLHKEPTVQALDPGFMCLWKNPLLHLFQIVMP